MMFDFPRPHRPARPRQMRPRPANHVNDPSAYPFSMRKVFFGKKDRIIILLLLIILHGEDQTGLFLCGSTSSSLGFAITYTTTIWMAVSNYSMIQRYIRSHTDGSFMIRRTKTPIGLSLPFSSAFKWGLAPLWTIHDPSCIPLGGTQHRAKPAHRLPEPF
jgi:hypothetical protein